MHHDAQYYLDVVSDYPVVLGLSKAVANLLKA